MSTHDQATFVIVGAGLAGGRAALALRKEGFAGRVVLIGDEPDPPYERPHASKQYLLGAETWADIALAPQDGWAERKIELRTGQTVAAIDRERREVALADGERIGYDRLLLATGSSPRPLGVPGGDHDAVLLLRTRVDADRLRTAIATGDRLIVIGGGWIGSEVASVARTLGSEVTLLVSGAAPLDRALGPEVGGAFTRLHRDKGVDVRLGAAVTSIEPAPGGLRLRTADGRTVEGRVALAGVGAAPRVDLAREAGLAIGTGVLVDELFRTDDPAVWAVGDVAEAWHPLLQTRVRLDHWAAAYFGGTAAAKSMLDQGVPYERIPYVYSDQYDSTLEWMGWAPTWQRVVFRGDPGTGVFSAFWLAGGRVAAAMHMNQPDARKPMEALIRAGRQIDPARLADPAVPLADLDGLAAD
jgi:3-phenylpropionate/trans-cinnamate dioxygenase ferredoxin reductase component